MIAMMGGFEFLFLLGVLLLIPLSLAMTAFWIWMLVDAAQNRGLTENERVMWVVIIALLHFLAALIYYFIGRPKSKMASPAIP